MTDSFAEPELSSIAGLGFIRGSNCPHYDGEATRRPAFTRLISEGMAAGFAADDGVGLHFVDGALHRVVSSREHARAYRVESIDGEVREHALEAERLIDSK